MGSTAILKVPHSSREELKKAVLGNQYEPAREAKNIIRTTHERVPRAGGHSELCHSSALTSARQ